jgi:hypothetical protein
MSKSKQDSGMKTLLAQIEGLRLDLIDDRNELGTAVRAISEKIDALKPAPKPAEPKYCEDCRWYSRDSLGRRFGKCSHLATKGYTLVARGVPGESCFIMRQDYSPCGSGAKLFEPRSIVLIEPRAKKRFWIFG